MRAGRLRVLAGGGVAVVGVAAVVGAVFAMVAGPYVAALSMQKHRFDFGDSGSLNYAWFAGGTHIPAERHATPPRRGTGELSAG